MKKRFVVPTTMMLSAGMILSNAGIAYADSVTAQPYLAFGADLKPGEKERVIELLEIEGDLDDYTVVEVTNKEEHEYLDGYLSSNVIGSRALSSVRIVKAGEGEGIHIETKNITYCTPEMYENAIATAGITDADITVAGPFEISGTSALVGVMKAYEDMTGEELSEESKDAATNELVVSGELADELDDPNKATEFIGFVKEKVAEKNDITTEEMQEIVDEGCEIYNIKLSKEQEKDILKLMQKIDKLDLDVNELKEQAKGIYDKIKNSDIDAGGFLSKLIRFIKSLFE